jgi:hypothetical protein
MPPTTNDVRDTLGATDLSDAELGDKITQADRLYAQRIDGEHVDADIHDDVVEYLAAHLVKAGPEPEVTGGDGTEFRVPDEGRFWRMATLLDPTGQLAGDDDGGGTSDHFTFST